MIYVYESVNKPHVREQIVRFRAICQQFHVRFCQNRYYCILNFPSANDIHYQDSMKNSLIIDFLENVHRICSVQPLNE